MNNTQTTKPNQCADCPCPCKPVFPILLIVLGVISLRGEILRMKDQKKASTPPSAIPCSSLA